MTVKAIDGIPITNPSRPITLHILSEDCKGGDPKRPSTCAAAKAIRRELQVMDCRVHLGRIYIRQNKGNWQRYKTPKALRTEIIAFDRGGSFEPGEFVLTPLSPKERNARGGKRKFKQARYNPNRKSRRPATIVQNVRGGPA